jgi:uncharacterized protein with ParB-like and HNH nuclease domain
MKIESRDQSIGDLLTSGYYVIPRFQRPYSWDSENISDFWADTIVNRANDYFIGSMVVYTLGERKFGVVDGQQRLTTIMILLSVVRDRLEERGFKDQADGLHKLIERENIENQKEFVLQTQTSYPYFQDRVLSRDESELQSELHQEEERIQKAHQQFGSLVDSLANSFDSNPALSPKKRSEKIKEALVGIRDSLLALKLIFITLDSEDDAYLIFETLNTRGKDLALADLVKNHFTKILKAKNKGIDQTTIKWNKVRETIEGSRAEVDTDTFIYHWWLSKYEYAASKKIYKEFRKIVTAGNAKIVLDDMVRDADYYRAIHEPSYWAWDKQAADARSSLYALNLFRVRQQVPTTLSLMRAFKAGRIKLAQFIRALGDIEKFHFLFTAITSQRSSGGISGMYASLGRQVAAVADAQEAAPVLNELRKKLKERVPSEPEFLALFPELIYTNTISKQRALVRYVLSRIARFEGHAFPADRDELTIEHLHPQSKIDGCEWSEEIVGQLGNLILVTKELNDKLENKSFVEKKAILLANKYDNFLPDYYWSAAELTPELVARRTQSIGSIAYNSVWKI